MVEKKLTFPIHIKKYEGVFFITLLNYFLGVFAFHPAIVFVLLFVVIFLIVCLVSFLKKKRDLNNVYQEAGFCYDAEQDIFYSYMDAWQRKFGYCELYDEAAAPLGMIIDCEPIRFDYEGKKWLIEFWKGQYGMSMGGEVGVYTKIATRFESDDSDDNEGFFYDRTDDDDHLKVAFELKKNGKKLFTRQARHWWLTGFKLGGFSHPSDLSMDIWVKLKTDEMCDKFVHALTKTGYTQEDLDIRGTIVNLTYKTPHSKQPSTRNAESDASQLLKNKAICEAYQNITGNFANSLEKLEYIKNNSPQLYKQILKFSRPKEKYLDYKYLLRKLR